MNINDILGNQNIIDSVEEDNIEDMDKEPTAAELYALEAELSAEKGKERVKRVQSIPKPKKPYVKPKPKVKSELPTDLFSSANTYKTNVMISLEDLNNQAEAEVKAYNTRITPLFEKVGKGDEIKFISEDLMREFISDYQDKDTNRTQMLKRYALTQDVVMYDLYKIIARHLGIALRNSSVEQGKQAKEQSRKDYSDSLNAKFVRIKETGYLIANTEENKRLFNVEQLNKSVTETAEGKAEDIVEDVKTEKGIDYLTLTQADYKIISHQVISDCIALWKRKQKEDAEFEKDVKKQEEIKQREDKSYDLSLPLAINADNAYLKYKKDIRRSMLYTINKSISE